MRHSQSTSSSRTSTKRRIPTNRGRRPHRLVHHRQYSRTCDQRAVHRPGRREIYVQRLKRSPSRPRFYRENPERVDKRRGRTNPLKKAKKETSHRDTPERKLSTREKNKALERLAEEIEELIRRYKKNQLSEILSQNIGSEGDTRGTPPETEAPPARPESE